MFLESEPANVLAHARHRSMTACDLVPILGLVLRISEQSSASKCSAQASAVLPEITR
jgi:hypothetical protein